MSMFCVQCGKQSGEGAQFCSQCGRPLTSDGLPRAPAAGSYRQGFGSLVRSRTGRKLAGVCQGLANHYGWDVLAIRICMVLLSIAAFPLGEILYVILWVITPEEALVLPQSASPTSYAD